MVVHALQHGEAPIATVALHGAMRVAATAHLPGDLAVDVHQDGVVKEDAQLTEEMADEQPTVEMVRVQHTEAMVLEQHMVGRHPTEAAQHTAATTAHELHMEASIQVAVPQVVHHGETLAPLNRPPMRSRLRLPVATMPPRLLPTQRRLQEHIPILLLLPAARQWMLPPQAATMLLLLLAIHPAREAGMEVMVRRHLEHRRQARGLLPRRQLQVDMTRILDMTELSR